jgi:S-adenosylmethionine synthetase
MRTMLRNYIFTSESVSEGHPDKMADRISDTIFDAALSQDRQSIVTYETLVKEDIAMLPGEMTTNASIDFDKITRDTVQSIGYDNIAAGFDAQSCFVASKIDKQSKDTAKGVNCEALGAGDQGFMFGYACSETKELMAAHIFICASLSRTAGFSSQK